MTTRLLHVMTVPLSLRFLGGQVGYMKARGLEVHALTSPGEELRAFGESEDIPVHAVEMPRRITPLRDIRCVRDLIDVMRRLRPHIVHSHTPKGGLLGMIAATLAGVPVRVYHIHGLPFATATGAKRVLLKATERVSCALAHRVLCVSHSLQDFAVVEKVCAPEKIRVLSCGSANGVEARGTYDPGRYSPEDTARVRAELGIPQGSPVIGFVGRIVREKGILELHEAWRMLRERQRDVHLLLVGPIEEQDAVPAHVLKELEDDPRVHLAGMRESAAPFYPVMDLLALPTYREGFPTVLLEAGAMSVPVVATEVPGCMDAVVDGTTGTLVPARNSAALGHALARYLEDPKLRLEHGAAARARILETFEQRSLWADLEKEYRELLASRVGHPAPAPVWESLRGSGQARS